MPPASLLLFAGAPRSSSLDWEHPELLNSFSESFSRFLGTASIDNLAQSGLGLAAEPLYPSWRAIPLERRHLATGHSQDHGWHKGSEHTTFFTTSAVGSFIRDLSPTPRVLTQTATSELTEQVLSQFYEQSYAKHNDIMSSQLAALSDAGTSHPSTYTSSDATHSSTGSPLQSFSRANEIPVSGNLSDLKDIPSALYLNSIQPQTVTVNIIVGIISLEPPKAIKTRRSADMCLVEVLVGDNTKSSFGISFWLPASKPVQGEMEAVLSGLRPQDIVLMRNIALSSFRGKVYGHSLRRDMTKVHLLYRNKIDRTDPGGCYNAVDLTNLCSQSEEQIKKTAMVREWCLKFIRSGETKSDPKSRASMVAYDELPADTQ